MNNSSTPMISRLQNIMQLSDPLKIQNHFADNFKHLPLHLYWKDEKGKYLGCNSTQAINAGFNNPEDMIGQTDFDLCWVTSDCANRFKIINEEVMATNQAKVLFEHALVRGKNMLTTFSHKMPLITHMGKTAGIIGLSILLDKNVLFPNVPTEKRTANKDNFKKIKNTRLSIQQEECLYYLVLGMTMKQIARQLSIAPKTVEHYLEAIKNKLNCYSRSELIATALQLPIIKFRLAIL